MNPIKYMLDHFDLIDLTKEYVVGKYDLNLNLDYSYDFNQVIDEKIKIEENHKQKRII